MNLNYLFDLSGLRDAIAQLPCAAFALEGGVSPFRYVEGAPGWLTGEIPPDAMPKEENPEDGKAVYLEFSSPDGWSDQAIVVNNTGQPSDEGALILRCKPTGDSDLGNFEVIVTRSQWQSGQGFSEARPITTGKEPIEVALNYQSVDPKWFYFSSYDSGDIYFYDADYKERPPHIATILRTGSQLMLDFESASGETFDYMFDLTGVSDEMRNLPCTIVRNILMVTQDALTPKRKAS
jgi:hypothetical protein